MAPDVFSSSRAKALGAPSKRRLCFCRLGGIPRIPIHTLRSPTNLGAPGLDSESWGTKNLIVRLGAMLTLALILATSARAQDTPTFRIDTKLVNLWVNVTDKNGAIVGQLTKDDFKITEDGRPQDIRI